MSKSPKYISKSNLANVGMKILIGVTIASNISIGSLLYVNVKSSEKISEKVDEVLSIHQQLSSNLREEIVSLQNDFLRLPDLFQANSHARIMETINNNFTLIEKQFLKGREEYTQYFGRKERRDLTQNKFITQLNSGLLTISRGIFDEQGQFTDSVERIILATNDPENDLRRLEELVTTFSSEASSDKTLEVKVYELGALVANVGLEAEKTRNEILDHVDSISDMEQQLDTFRIDQKRYTVGAAGFAIFANMLVLFFLVRTIVENPLRNLTRTIDEIRAGKSPDVPYGHRTDQIGVLSGAINNFREALSAIQQENKRKEHEKIIIDEMFANITTVVDDLGSRSRELVNTANLLENLAISTETQSGSVQQQASATAGHTNRVSESTVRLQQAFQDINQQIAIQNTIVGTILDQNTKSREYIDSLNLSIRDIHTIIAMVSEITDQTKLLALNATIEAARTGTAGKGFGVVASEVKELSLKTENATGDVMNRVKAIEKATTVLVANLQDIDERVQDLNKLTNNVTRAVHMQQSETGSIADLAVQTANNTQHVSTSICKVSSAATKTRGLAGQVHSFSNEIASQLSQLLDDTSRRLQQLAEREAHLTDLEN